MHLSQTASAVPLTQQSSQQTAFELPALSGRNSAPGQQHPHGRPFERLLCDAATLVTPQCCIGYRLKFDVQLGRRLSIPNRCATTRFTIGGSANWRPRSSPPGATATPRLQLKAIRLRGVLHRSLCDKSMRRPTATPAKRTTRTTRMISIRSSTRPMPSCAPRHGPSSGATRAGIEDAVSIRRKWQWRPTCRVSLKLSGSCLRS
jgi:hypothetical protein